MFMYNGREIKVRKSWRDDNGVRHPRNWNIWSAEEKEVVGIVEIEIKKDRLIPQIISYLSNCNRYTKVFPRCITPVFCDVLPPIFK